LVAKGRFSGGSIDLGFSDDALYAFYTPSGLGELPIVFVFGAGVTC
jgi:hypothetical protein